MPFDRNQILNQQRQVGDTSAISSWGQLPLLSNPQQAAQWAMLGRGLYGLSGLGQPSASFEPIKQKYIQDFRNNQLPGLFNEHTGNVDSSAFARSIAGREDALRTNLAALESKHNQNMIQQNRDYSLGLLKQGMQPSFENMYSPEPYTAAEQYLIKQGIPNPTVDQVNNIMSRMKPTQNFTGQLPEYLRQGKETATTLANAFQEGGGNDLRNAYQQGGLKAAAGKLGGGLLAAGKEGANMLFNQPAPYGAAPEQSLTGAGKALLETDPAVATATEKNLSRATPEQKQATFQAISRVASVNPHILKATGLTPENYQQLDALEGADNEKVRSILPLIRTRKELETLHQHWKKKRSIDLRFFLRKLKKLRAKEEGGK